jgi:hypothetical protein
MNICNHHVVHANVLSNVRVKLQASVLSAGRGSDFQTNRHISRYEAQKYSLNVNAEIEDRDSRPNRASSSGGRSQDVSAGRGRGGGKGGFKPSTPSKGLSSTQKQLLFNLDDLREGPGSGKHEPEDYVVVRPPTKSRGQSLEPNSTSGPASVAMTQSDEELDGSRFWREASGWSGDEDGEEGGGSI